MSNSICRAFTFINYHIPIIKDDKMQPQYSTIGYMDGMHTEVINVNYADENLKNLWKYVLEKTEENEGKFSYQNIFGFSKDVWNKWSDTEFWSEQTDFEFPLTIVVLLQTGAYLDKGRIDGIQVQNFNDILQQNAARDARWYTYQTIDKNDFIVCIKSKSYTEIINAIKELHREGLAIVYSYSVLSIRQAVLDKMDEKSYKYLYQEKLDSISLKGIINSYKGNANITLEDKYTEFAGKLIEGLYSENPKSDAWRMYEILGDNDFCLTAKDVSLGRLLKQFADGGILNYCNDKLRFYLYSSNLILYTKDSMKKSVKEIANDDLIKEMNATFKSTKCDELEIRVLAMRENIRSSGKMDEKAITICQAVWQLLQSLKVFEYSPAKKYDFYSLYHPFELLISILENELKLGVIQEGKEIYEFLQKISFTLNGTLRTDIQFRQERDFNVLVGYAPAKLRAFYSIWAFCLSDFYNALSQGENKYSFIFSPGVYPKTYVTQLRVKKEEGKNEETKERLMLMTIPERNLYATNRMSIILAHEVSHFVGRKARNRTTRHEIWRRICTRVLALELEKFLYYGVEQNEETKLRVWIKGMESFSDKLAKLIERKEGLIENGGVDDDVQFHSAISISRIKKAFCEIKENERELLIADFFSKIRKEIFSEEKMNIDAIATWTAYFNDKEEKWNMLLVNFRFRALESILRALCYICGEMFADTMSILTLGLQPREYILSFKEEAFSEEMNGREMSEGFLKVRIGIVAEIMKQVFSNSNFQIISIEAEFCERWKEGISEAFLQSFGEATSERKLVASVYGYIEGIRNCSESITRYKSILDAEGKYTQTEWDWLNDKSIFEMLGYYIEACIKFYIDRLRHSPESVDHRKELEDVYKTISSDSITGMVDEIELFLKKYEKNEKK